ncbi:DDE-type integrase/transposase/recombinase [Helicobacter sp. 14348-15]|uniref:integrase catalytic domain-containing protein n=1 Tax=Helicobacter colisuis TaxID=2949739 RepID=UPI00202B9094|nr:DDE-type integrase/transposase/recombinase [Helicobacter colisuis]MCL9820960.1 DDE-type integrase/transposase/recombinase [Helicobacter colisuis]
MAWISSKEFAKKYNISDRAIRAQASKKKILTIHTKYFSYIYRSGIGGGGKILQIWDTPLSEAQAQAIEKGYPFEYVLEMESNESTSMISKEVSGVDLENRDTKQPIKATLSTDCFRQSSRNNRVKTAKAEGKDITAESIKSPKETDINKNSTQKHSLFSLTPNQKSQALARELILQEYESAKLNGMKVSHFITLKNREDVSLKLTQGKLFDWARKYKEQGLAGLADKRGVAKIGTSKLPTWAKQEVLNLYRQMGSGYCNRMQIWRSLHMKACEYMNFNYEKFLKCEIPPLFSLNSMNLFLDRYLKENSLEHALISYGSDKTDSYREPAYGVQRELYTSPNQLWQMDSSPLDAIVLGEDFKQMRPHFISIVDVYSGRSVGGIATTSDSNAVVRILWKAFKGMGKPKAIQFDNGKDYLSKKVQGLIAGLGIKYVRSAAYKGKAKAVVERRFRTIQGSYIAALNGYIGRNTGERSIIEQQVAKRERRSKDAFGNPLKTQQKELLPLSLVTTYLDEAIEYWNIDRVSRRWGKNEGKSPMDLWYASDFIREEVSYMQFLLYAEEPKLRTMEKEGVSIKPFTYVPTRYIPAKTKVHVRINIDSSNEAFIFDEQGEFICNAYDKKARPLSQEELKAISKEYKIAIKRAKELRDDATHSSFIRMNAKLEIENLKNKEEEAKRSGNGIKGEVRKSIAEEQTQKNAEDTWEPKNLPQNNQEKGGDWDSILEKLA